MIGSLHLGRARADLVDFPKRRTGEVGSMQNRVMGDEDLYGAGHPGEASGDILRPVAQEPNIVLPAWVPDLRYGTGEEPLDRLMAHPQAEAAQIRLPDP